LYQVANCENCGNDGLVVDQTLYDISCIFSVDHWVYTFKNKNSNTTFITQVVVLNGSVIIDGNFNQSSDSNLVIILSSSNKNGAVNVTGCVSINGNISLVLNQQVTNGNETFSLISYNCNENLSISDTQIVVDPKYQNSQCDTIKTQINNNQNSLSVSISSTSNKCGKKISSGAILGIIFAVIGVALIIVVIISVLLYQRRRNTKKMVKTVDNEMNSRN
jgi:hypothetical protein